MINRNLKEFYNKSSEEDRLSQGLGPLEFERNKKLIQKHISAANITILDVGGGPGKYAAWLAQMGHQVTLVDPIRKHVNQAKKRSGKLDNKFISLLGEARNLDMPDDFADMVILHGPLYHLQKKEDRIIALTEAKRVVKKEGIVLGFAINYTASTLVGLLQGVFHEENIFNMCRSELTTGIHNAPESMPGVLTEAYYHRPDELKSEFQEVNLRDLEMHSVEGIIWLDKNYYSSRADEKNYDNLLELLHITEKDPNLMAFSPHLMISGRK